MPRIPIPVPGQPIAPVITDASLWAEILEMLEWYKATGPNQPAPDNGDTYGMLIKADEKRDAGTVVCLSEHENADLPESQQTRPISLAAAPDYSTISTGGLRKLVILPTMLGRADDTIEVLSTRFVVAEFEGTIDVDHKFAMVDYTTPTKLRSGQSGFCRIMFKLTDTTALVDLQQSQTVFEFSNFNGGNATLHDLGRGHTFGSVPIVGFNGGDPPADGWCVFVDGVFQFLSGGSSGYFAFQLNTDPVSATATHLQAEAAIFNDSGVALFITQEFYLFQPLFSDMKANDEGICMLSNGKYYAINAPCLIDPNEGPVEPDPSNPDGPFVPPEPLAMLRRNANLPS